MILPGCLLLEPIMALLEHPSPTHTHTHLQAEKFTPPHANTHTPHNQDVVTWQHHFKVNGCYKKVLCKENGGCLCRMLRLRSEADSFLCWGKRCYLTGGEESCMTGKTSVCFARIQAAIKLPGCCVFLSGFAY